MFSIFETYQLIDSCVVTDVAFQVWIGFAPLFGSHSKHSHIQHVGFLGINDACLSSRDFCWYQVVLDGIGVYVVVYFG